MAPREQTSASRSQKGANILSSSRRERERSPYCNNESYTREYPTLVAVISDERAAKFEDGSIERDNDAIILCTG